MTKSTDINSLYNEVGKLLNDICNFINEECNIGCISPNGKSTAQLLIRRSKQQLEAIAMAVADPSVESYVDMHGAKVNYEYQDQNNQEFYSDVSLIFDKSSNTSAVEDDRISCPFENSPANKILDGKRGNLYRKEKILFFEKQKEIYACVQQPWLLIYNNEDSMKPTQTFDLAHFEAEPLSTKFKDKRRDESFDLVSNSNSKFFRFIARTEKDMLQWVSAINNSVEKKHARSNSYLQPNESDDENCGDTYEPLKEYQLSKENNGRDHLKPPSIPLPLPPRPKPKQEISPTPSQDSLSEYDFVGVGPTTAKSNDGTSNSFSEDDVDQHYDDPGDLKNDDDDNIYDYLQPPPISHKQPDPIDPKPTPKPLLKPKLLTFRNSKKDF